MDTREHAPLATISHVKIYNDATTPPQVSTNSATNITRSSATLNATLSTLGDFTTVNTLFRYRVFGSSGPYTETTPQTATVAGPFTANISGLVPGTTYEFVPVVQWAGRDGTQEISGSQATFATPTTPTAPAPVMDLQAAAAGIDQINLSWSAPNDNGSPITGYKIERSLDGITWSVIVSDTGSASTAYQDKDRDPNTKYYYRVSAINGVGVSSTSNAADATTANIAPVSTNSSTLANTGQSVGLILIATLLLITGSLFTLVRFKIHRIGN